MATYKKYTNCCKPEDFERPPYGESFAYGILASILTLLGSIAASGGISLLTGVLTTLLLLATVALNFVDWWLNRRLICLGGIRCAVGMVLKIETPEKKTGIDRFDTDYCFLLLLPPHRIGSQQSVYTDTKLCDKLITNTEIVKALNLDFKGHTAEVTELIPNTNDPKLPGTAALMCECEGRGMDILKQYLTALVAMLAVGSVASWFCWVPIIGWIACAVALAIAVAAVVSILPSLLHAQDDVAGLSDMPELGGSLHQYAEDGNNADFVVVYGDWVYDGMHDGWNEIHPVHHCQKLSGLKWDGYWPDVFFRGRRGEEFFKEDKVKEWCKSIKNASSPSTQANQQKPENQWEIHPDIDGCMPNVTPIP
jgi:hypothetical protein